MIRDNFFIIRSSTVDIGIDRNQIHSSFPENKKKFLLNSCPKHSSKINEFLISKKLISFHDFSIFANDTHYITEAEKDGWGWIWNAGWIKKNGVNYKNPFLDDADKMYKTAAGAPVLQISWNDASAYCNWYTGRYLLNTRLPSETEWEAASKMFGAGSFDEIKNINQVNEENIINTVEFVEILIENSKSHFTPSGILWEWTSDWFDSYGTEIKNKEFGKVYKVLRGGSLLSEPYQKCSEYRFRRCPTARSPYYGFRIVVEINC